MIVSFLGLPRGRVGADATASNNEADDAEADETDDANVAVTGSTIGSLSNVKPVAVVVVVSVCVVIFFSRIDEQLKKKKKNKQKRKKQKKKKKNLRFLIEFVHLLFERVLL